MAAANGGENLWKDAEYQLKELDLDIDGEGATDPWDSAAHNQVSTIVVRTRPMNDDDDDDDDAAS